MGGAPNTRKLLSSHTWEVKEQDSNSGRADATVLAFLSHETAKKSKAYTDKATFQLGLEEQSGFRVQYGVRGGGKAALAEERRGACRGRPARQAGEEIGWQRSENWETQTWGA